MFYATFDIMYQQSYVWWNFQYNVSYYIDIMCDTTFFIMFNKIFAPMPYLTFEVMLDIILDNMKDLS